MLVDLGWGGDLTGDKPTADLLDSSQLQLGAGGSGDREVCIGRDVDKPRGPQTARKGPSVG
ncbi:MAG TPA: hypothetical protein VE673_18605 [Pseudonocardiaceae bacterium]|nr:hypothetical protein [Pseudonocardiaceae bacterium]